MTTTRVEMEELDNSLFPDHPEFKMLNYASAFYKNHFIFSDYKYKRNYDFFEFDSISKQITSSSVPYFDHFTQNWPVGYFGLVAHEKRQSLILVGGEDLCFGGPMEWILEQSFITREWTAITREADPEGLAGICIKAILLDDNTILALGHYYDANTDMETYRLAAFDIPSKKWSLKLDFSTNNPYGMVQLNKRTVLILFADSALCYDLVNGDKRDLPHCAQFLKKLEEKRPRGVYVSCNLAYCKQDKVLVFFNNKVTVEIDAAKDNCSIVQCEFPMEPSLVLQHSLKECYVLGVADSKVKGVRLTLEHKLWNQLLWQKQQNKFHDIRFEFQ